MKNTVVVPVSDKNGLDAPIADHFGRAPFFAVVVLGEDKKIESIKTVENEGEHFGGHGHMHDHVLELKPDAIIAYGMGPGGLISFQGAGVSVLQANANATTVKEVIEAYEKNELQELTEGCHQARHHGHCR